MMETIFNQQTIDNFVDRVKRLKADKNAVWGKMTPYQMVKHCILSEQMYLGDTKYKRLFIGRLFGAMALKSIVKDKSPMKQNQPTHPTFKIKGDGNLDEQKNIWINLINRYGEKVSFAEFVHPFFGKMTKDQIGIYVYKHIDHHLRQFGI